MPFALTINLLFAKKFKFFLPHDEPPLYMDVQGRDDEGFINNLYRITFNLQNKTPKLIIKTSRVKGQTLRAKGTTSRVKGQMSRV